MQKFKRVTSAALGTLMTGASLLAPAFADLSTFGTWTPANTLVVVGADADAVDIVGGMNIAAAVAQHGATGKSGSSSVAGAESEDVDLNAALSAEFTTLDNNDLAGFQEGSIEWNDEEIDFEETLSVANVRVLTSDTVVGETGADEDFGADVVLGTTTTEAIKYEYVLDDSDLNISAVTEDDALYVEILGQSLKITDVNDAATDSITYEAGTKVALGVGDSVKVGTKTLTVKSIGESSVSLDVDGQTEIVSEDDSSEEIGSTDVKVTVEDILYTDDVDSRQVSMLVGTETTETVSDGESMELFGEPEKENDATWVWQVAVTGTTKLVLGAYHNQQLDNEDEDVLAVGDSWSLPNEYATLTFNGLTVEADGEYVVELDDSIKPVEYENGTVISNAATYEGVVLTSSASDGFTVVANGIYEDTDTVYVMAYTASNVSAAYENSEGDIVFFTDHFGSNAALGEDFQITYQDTTRNVSVTALGSSKVNITVEDLDGDFGTDDLVMANIDMGNQRLGATDAEDEGSELYWNDVATGSRDTDLRTEYGNVIVNPEDEGSADRYTLLIPSEQVEATVTVTGPEAATTTVGSGNVNFVSLGNGVAATTADVDAADKAEKNLILVGGPYANDLVNELAEEGKTYTREEWDGMTGQAIVQYVAGGFAEENDVIIVAGYSAADTRAAALALATESLTGTGVSWMGSTEESFEYEAPAAEEDAEAEETTEETAEE